MTNRWINVVPSTRLAKLLEASRYPKRPFAPDGSLIDAIFHHGESSSLKSPLAPATPVCSGTQKFSSPIVVLSLPLSLSLSASLSFSLFRIILDSLTGPAVPRLSPSDTR